MKEYMIQIVPLNRQPLISYFSDQSKYYSRQSLELVTQLTRVVSLFRDTVASGRERYSTVVILRELYLLPRTVMLKPCSLVDPRGGIMTLSCQSDG